MSMEERPMEVSPRVLARIGGAAWSSIAHAAVITVQSFLTDRAVEAFCRP
jgi:hypothetical protein